MSQAIEEINYSRQELPGRSFLSINGFCHIIPKTTFYERGSFSLSFSGVD
jgi:hypothetical protein